MTLSEILAPYGFEPKHGMFPLGAPPVCMFCYVHYRARHAIAVALRQVLEEGPERWPLIAARSQHAKHSIGPPGQLPGRASFGYALAVHLFKIRFAEVGLSGDAHISLEQTLEQLLSLEVPRRGKIQVSHLLIML